jgi:phosphoglycolate phosphatase
MRTVIFDLDGTIADTSHDLIASANVCFRDMGHGDVLDPARDFKIAMTGGGRAMLRLGFDRLGQGKSEDWIEKYYPVLLTAYAENIDKYTTLYPGVASAIEGVLARGYAVGMCTNKPQVLADELLSRLGIRGLFGSLVGADTLAVRKPDPAPLWLAIDQLGGNREKSVLVGDTPTDRETARAASVHSLLVTFGPDGQGVSDLQPDALLHSYGDLSGAVFDLIG